MIYGDYKFCQVSRDLLFSAMHVYVCMSVCPPPRLFQINGTILTLYDWSNKITAVVVSALLVGVALELKYICHSNK